MPGDYEIYDQGITVRASNDMHDTVRSCKRRRRKYFSWPRRWVYPFVSLLLINYSWHSLVRK